MWFDSWNDLARVVTVAAAAYAALVVACGSRAGARSPRSSRPPARSVVDHHALSPGRTVVTSTPTTVLRDGVVDAVAMRAQRLTTAELRQAVRSSGVGGFDQVARVVLETDGTLSVIPAGRVGDGKALERDER